MYKVELKIEYRDDVWIFEDYETATLFAKMAIDNGTANVKVKISRVWEDKQDESL